MLMDLKLPTIFLLFTLVIIIPIQVNAFTVCDLLSSQNITASEIQQAVDNGSIQYSDLPGSFQVNIHAQGQTISQPTKAITDNSMPCSTSKPDNSWTGIIVMISIMLSPVVFLIGSGHLQLPGLFRIRQENKSLHHISPSDYYSPTRKGTMPKGWKNESNPFIEKPKPLHPPHARLLLLLKIIRVKKQNA